MASGICARHHPHHALSTGVEFSAGNHNLSPENRSKLQPWNRRRNQSLLSHHRNSLKLAGIHGRSLASGALETPVPRSSYHYNHHHGIRHSHRRTTPSATQYSPETALSNHRFHSHSLPKLTVVNRSQQALSVSSMASLDNTVYSFKLSHNAAEAFGSRRNRRLAAKSRCVTFNRRRLVVRAAETDTNEVKAKVPDKAPVDNGSSINQILGIKGAKQETDKLKIRVQLMKPVTWPPLIWGVVCGAAASGNFHWTVEDVAKSIVCMLMSGPCLTGYTQTINDWYDREIDAINEPYRPIPSGAIAEDEVITQIWVLLLAGLGLAGLLDVWAGHDFPVIFYLAVGGSLLSYIYSAPPLKLKQNGWIGNFALGASYISLPWWAGQALFGTLTPDIIVLTLLYSIAGLGIAIVNDFKSIEGDRKMGLQSLPVAFGLENAKWICVGAIDITQLSVAGYLLSVGKPYYALALLGLIAPQVFFQFKYFLKDPVKYDVKYQASAQPFLILGLLVTALATSH